MIVAFTIGNTKSYDQSIQDDPNNCFKIGIRSVDDNGKTWDYDGGWIWKTESEAQIFINSKEFLEVDWGDGLPRDPKKFSVYKVLLVNGWNDVSSEPGKDNIHHLLVDSRFTK